VALAVPCLAAQMMSFSGPLPVGHPGPTAPAAPVHVDAEAPPHSQAAPSAQDQLTAFEPLLKPCLSDPPGRLGPPPIEESPVPQFLLLHLAAHLGQLAPGFLERACGHSCPLGSAVLARVHLLPALGAPTHCLPRTEPSRSPPAIESR